MHTCIQGVRRPRAGAAAWDWTQPARSVRDSRACEACRSRDLWENTQYVFILCGSLGKTREMFGNRICLDCRTILNRPRCQWASHPDPCSMAGVSVGRAVVAFPCAPRGWTAGPTVVAHSTAALAGCLAVPPEVVAFATPCPMEVPAAWLACWKTRAAPLLIAHCGLSAFTRDLCPPSSASFPEGRPCGFLTGSKNRHRVGPQSVAAQTLGKRGSFQLTTWAVGETHVHILFWP